MTPLNLFPVSDCLFHFSLILIASTELN